MVILFSCVNTILLFLATTFVAIHGYHRSPVDGETTVLGYRYGDDTGLNKRETGKNVMWIGPRLGRRKRSEDDINNVNLQDKNGGAVVEFFQDSPWAFVALKENKRRTVNFIPRLGRDSEEEYGDGAVDASYMKSISRSGSQIIGPFGGGNNFTPRLGRFAALYNREHL